MSTVATTAADLKAKKIAFYADPNTKPVVAPPDFDAIPEELRREHRWALWQLVQRDGKWTKRPCQANGFGAKANDPATWAPFESVRRASMRGGFDGIGIMLGGGLAGVDLDGVRDPDTGKFTRAAGQLGKQFKTYAEVSPSGTGAKLIGRGVWRAGRHRKPFHGGEIEVYDDNGSS